MDLLGNLKKLLGIQAPQNAQPIAQRIQSQASPRQAQRVVKPGYEDAAQRYEAAFDRGELNSPDIIGVDPASFGYPADQTVSPLTSAEDDAYVQTAQGRMPLSSVGRGQSFQNIQGPTQYAGPTRVGNPLADLNALLRRR